MTVTPDLCLFVGHHKVGSTSLQRYLSFNAPTLLKAGLLYPAVRPLDVGPLLRDNRPPMPRLYRPDISQVEPHNSLAFSLIEDAGGPTAPPFIGSVPKPAEMLQLIRQQIEEEQPKATLIVSEVLSRAADVDVAIAHTLKDSIPHDRANVLITLRHPVEYLASFYAQLVKMGARVPAMRGKFFRNHLHTVHADYAKLVAPWVDAFGAASVSVVSYEDVLQRGDSIADFCVRAEITAPENAVAVGRSNPSLHYAFVEAQRRANATLSPESARHLKRFFMKAQRKLKLPKSGNVKLYGPGQKRKLMRQLPQMREDLTALLGHDPLPQSWSRPVKTPIWEEEAMTYGLEMARALPDAAILPSEALDFLKRVAWSEAA